MKRFLTVISFALCSALFTGVAAQERECKPHCPPVWSFYVEEGATMVHGLGMPGKDAAPGMNIFAEIGAGASFSIRPWLRLGVNYDFSKYAREQRFSEFQPLETPSGDGELSEQYGGLAYSKMWTRYHAVDFTMEYNVLKLWKNCPCKRFGLYAGTGFGWLFAKGNTYDILVGHERWSEEYKETINTWMNAVNKRHKFNSAYIPVQLSAEYGISPAVAAGVRGSYKILLGNHGDYAPKGIGTLSAVLKINIAAP